MSCRGGRTLICSQTYPRTSCLLFLCSCVTTTCINRSFDTPSSFIARLMYTRLWSSQWYEIVVERGVRPICQIESHLLVTIAYCFWEDISKALHRMLHIWYLINLAYTGITSHLCACTLKRSYNTHDILMLDRLICICSQDTKFRLCECVMEGRCLNQCNYYVSTAGWQMMQMIIHSFVYSLYLIIQHIHRLLHCLGSQLYTMPSFYLLRQHFIYKLVLFYHW